MNKYITERYLGHKPTLNLRMSSLPPPLWGRNSYLAQLVLRSRSDDSHVPFLYVCSISWSHPSPNRRNEPLRPRLNQTCGGAAAKSRRRRGRPQAPLVRVVRLGCPPRVCLILKRMNPGLLAPCSAAPRRSHGCAHCVFLVSFPIIFYFPVLLFKFCFLICWTIFTDMI